MPGDFDEDADVDGEDLTQWQGDFGLNGSSDSDDDGDSDGADFLNWQRTFGVGQPAPAISSTVSPIVPQNSTPVNAEAAGIDLHLTAVDLAIVTENLWSKPSATPSSVTAPEIAIDWALQPSSESARPAHRATIRLAYQSEEAPSEEKDLPAELDDELEVLDVLFARL